MEEHSTEDLRRLLVEIASEVAGYMRDIAGSKGLDSVLRIGAGGDQTRRADVVAEDLAVELIRKEHLPVRIVTEESGIIDLVSKPEYIILMDPLDGSMNYVSLIPFAAVSMAIAYYREPYFSKILAGAISNIFLKETYSFSKDRVCIDGSLYKSSSINTGAIVVYANNPRLYSLVSMFVKESPGYRVRVLGSASLELSYVGLNRISLFYNDSGKLRNVDIAPAASFTKKTGCIIVDVYGRELDFRLDNLYRVKSIIAGKKDELDRFLKFLKDRGYAVTY